MLARLLIALCLSADAEARSSLIPGSRVRAAAPICASDVRLMFACKISWRRRCSAMRVELSIRTGFRITQPKALLMRSHVGRRRWGNPLA